MPWCDWAMLNNLEKTPDECIACTKKGAIAGAVSSLAGPFTGREKTLFLLRLL